MKKIKILFLDSEGGHGGSSKSLFVMVKNLNKIKFEPTVICRRYSNIYEEYKRNNINCYIYKNIPKLTAVKREKVNFYSIIKFYFYDWIKSYKCRKKLDIISQDFDYVHFNHINLFLLAKWLRKKNKKSKFTMHIRTNPWINTSSKLQAQIAKKNIEKFIFITDNELITFKKLLNNKKVSGAVINNIVERKKTTSSAFNFLKKKNTFNIGLISNYSYFRGTDRFIEIIIELKKITKKKFLFIIAGDNYFSNYDKKKLNIQDSSSKNLIDLARKENVSQFCSFLGHIKNPEDLYPHINVLIKPTRENNPWGRDILEAMVNGVPVISVGNYNKFVNNKTGFLMNEFNAKQCATYINKIMMNKNQLNQLSKNAAETVNLFCASDVCNKKIEKFWV